MFLSPPFRAWTFLQLINNYLPPTYNLRQVPFQYYKKQNQHQNTKNKTQKYL